MRKYTRYRKVVLVSGFCLAFILSLVFRYISVLNAGKGPYLRPLGEIYHTFGNFYYFPLLKKNYRLFVGEYTRNVVLPALKDANDTGPNPRLNWKACAALTSFLKMPKDPLTRFIPSDQLNGQFKLAYGYDIGTGISGSDTGKGFLVEKVEKHSNAYKRGVRPGQVIIRVNGIDASVLGGTMITNMLEGNNGLGLELELFSPDTGLYGTCSVMNTPFFIETVLEEPTGKKGVRCIAIKHFNKKTAEDVDEFIEKFLEEGMTGLIIDLRGNSGGPPLAVMDIASTFVPPGVTIAGFYKKNAVPFGLITKRKDISYSERLMLIVDGTTAGPAEILAAGLQFFKRAVIAGTERTAGLAFIRELFRLEDGSGLEMITGKPFLPAWGEDFSLFIEDVVPDVPLPKEHHDLVGYVARNYF
ncbi:MAG: S41 family peptidase [Candidatus Omnitrophica bacterium]|nr:S41 family peptidase [Candidatus Omnitrophota bacterium]MDD5488603.1 S41 family peptidase [Candidatus Omnitrophota bacterium]